MRILGAMVDSKIVYQRNRQWIVGLVDLVVLEFTATGGSDGGEVLIRR